ncbi:hypothetical protein EG68_09691 [Paragonimus skrjabini miyazakii]|uniref:Uncharacterized protein n=1 Tax=Paragonimus skrjabini miyazakii TaxID=59628 RepID=A0A8S9YMQ0_9TREM|nr:hypothetical protein EG68_09691 [Paragonimus skrjabini miyazakii]
MRVSSGIFQEAIGKLISSLGGALAYQIDAVIFGTTKQEHNHNRKRLLKRFAEKNVPFKPPKCTEPELLGFTVDAKSYRLDSNRFKPSMNMKSPKDILNRIFNEQPELVYTLPCSWNVQVSPYSRHRGCFIIWPLSAEARTKALRDDTEEVRLAHCNARTKPESTFPNERLIKNFTDHGQPLLRKCDNYFF